MKKNITEFCQHVYRIVKVIPRIESKTRALIGVTYDVDTSFILKECLSCEKVIKEDVNYDVALYLKKKYFSCYFEIKTRPMMRGEIRNCRCQN